MRETTQPTKQASDLLSFTGHPDRDLVDLSPREWEMVRVRMDGYEGLAQALHGYRWLGWF